MVLFLNQWEILPFVQKKARSWFAKNELYFKFLFLLKEQLFYH